MPRSGALDQPALRLANRLVGNAASAAGLETTLTGVAFRAARAPNVAVTGARCDVRVDGRPAGWGAALTVAAGAEVRVGPATDGLRTLTGRVNRDGTVTLWAVTSTVSGATDTGADPNRLVTVTDRVAATAPGDERFTTVRTARGGEALRGVVAVPGARW